MLVEKATELGVGAAAAGDHPPHRRRAGQPRADAGAGHRSGGAVRASHRSRRSLSPTPLDALLADWPEAPTAAVHGRTRVRPADRRGHRRLRRPGRPGRRAARHPRRPGGRLRRGRGRDAPRARLRRAGQPGPAHPARRDGGARGACMLAGFRRRLARREPRASDGMSGPSHEPQEPATDKRRLSSTWRAAASLGRAVADRHRAREARLPAAGLSAAALRRPAGHPRHPARASPGSAGSRCSRTAI